MGRLFRQRFIIVGAVTLCIIVVLAVWLRTLLDMNHHTATTKTFSKVVSNIKTFQPYTFRVLDGFAVDDSSIGYSQDVLIFRLNNTIGQTIAVTEQLLPSSVADGVSPNATQVQGVDGTGIITYNGTATTGALFTTTHHSRQTMVLLNTSAPVSQSTIEDLLRGLRPTS